MAYQSTKSRRQNDDTLPSIPHSWDLSKWPSHVFPGETRRGRWLVRAHRNELMLHGALSRAGRTIVVIGSGYAAWLEQRAARVPGYLSNNPTMRTRDDVAESL